MPTDDLADLPLKALELPSKTVSKLKPLEARTVRDLYPTQWRMVRGGVHAFGDVAASDVSVACDGAFRVLPAIIDGHFDMPAHEQRIASRNAALLRSFVHGRTTGTGVVP